MLEDFLGAFPRDHGTEFLKSSAPNVGDAAKFAQQFLCGARAHSGASNEGGFGLALAAALAVKRDGKAVSPIANLLYKMQDGRVALENNRLILLSENVEDFFFFGDARERLIDDLQRVERLSRSVELADAAID